MSQNENQYTLAPGELGTIAQLLKLQYVIGHGVVPSPSYDVVKSFMDNLADLAAVSPSLSNPTFKGWVDQIFASLIATDTCHNCKLPDLYVAHHYGLNARAMRPISIFKPEDRSKFYPLTSESNYYVAFLYGLSVAVPDRVPAWHWKNFPSWREPSALSPGYPKSPPPWVTAVDAVLAAWGANPPDNLINKGLGALPNLDRVLDFQKKLVSSDWTDFDKVKKNTAGVWTSQKQTTLSLLQPVTLTGDSYVFFLYILIALATGDAASQSLAQQIVSAQTNSPEYPHDIFINGLVYLSLMHLADPLGPFTLNNQQLQAGLKDLEVVIEGQDPVSTAVRRSIADQGKILHADSAYPMQDPYSPNVGFNQRKTDMLAALDKARAAVKTAVIAGGSS
jgi:hypothetical protein